jgi:hypothetical protein
VDQAGLARAGGADDGHQPGAVVEQVGEGREFGAATDEGIAFRQQVVRHLAHRSPRVTGADHAPGLLAVGRRLEGQRAVGDLEDADRLVDALQHVVAPRFRHGRAGVGEGRRGIGAEQRAPRPREGHHPRGDGFGEPVHLEALGSASHVLFGVLPHRHRAEVDADARLQSELRAGAVIGQREGRRSTHITEEQEEAVAAVDLQPAVVGQQAPRTPVVLVPHRRGARVAQPLHDQRAVDHIGEHQRSRVHPLPWRSS